MKIKVWVCTNMVGSEVNREIEIDDEELEGMTDSEKDEYIEDYCGDELSSMFEWGWDELTG